MHVNNLLLQVTVLFFETGQLAEYTNFAAGQPDNYNNNEHCAEIMPSNGQWNDAFCNGRKGRACQSPGAGHCPNAPAGTDELVGEKCYIKELF